MASEFQDTILVQQCINREGKLTFPIEIGVSSIN